MKEAKEEQDEEKNQRGKWIDAVGMSTMMRRGDGRIKRSGKRYRMNKCGESDEKQKQELKVGRKNGGKMGGGGRGLKDITIREVTRGEEVEKRGKVKIKEWVGVGDKKQNEYDGDRKKRRRRCTRKRKMRTMSKGRSTGRRNVCKEG
ncbi:hypothetical protein PoB_002687300 [Plakobranchus ocellatus]|uniref:Uncharacterized protein n=1 Tax=Plakobranchus ocellatus TaxID=259542 RepID=A0AAV3ZZP6_9GAST|nr:hypothetical protein PoB_002687300 [Plakobranchus ocellatus]